MYIVTAELQTENVEYYKKIQLYGFSAHPDVSSSQLIRINGVVLYVCVCVYVCMYYVYMYVYMHVCR
jgi:hypothetical protein